MKKTEKRLALLLALLLLVSAGCTPSSQTDSKDGGKASVQPTEEPVPTQAEPEETLDPETVELYQARAQRWLSATGCFIVTAFASTLLAAFFT